MKLISELISGISRVLQKLHNYFNGTAISTSFVFTLFGVFPVIYFFLDLNDSECLNGAQFLRKCFFILLSACIHHYNYINLILAF